MLPYAVRKLDPHATYLARSRADGRQPNRPRIPCGSVPAGGGAPTPSIGLSDAIVVIVGIVVGAGSQNPVPRAPATGWHGAALWVLGGFVTLIGALCTPRSSRLPAPGGEYQSCAAARQGAPFLFAWSA